MSTSAGEPVLDYENAADRPPSLGRDILSAYLVTASRMLAWIVVIAAVVRIAGNSAFALLAIVGSTVGILEYAAIGLSPAIIRLTAEAIQNHLAQNQPAENSSARVTPNQPIYNAQAVRDVYANGFAMALLTALCGGAFLIIFLFFFRHTHINQNSKGVALELVLMVGMATLLRMMSDAPGAVLQTCGRIFRDNLLLTTHELIWAGGTLIDLFIFHLPWQRATGFALLAGSLCLLITRALASHATVEGLFKHWWKRIDRRTVQRLLIFGGMVVAAQAADYLYAPCNNLLILNFINQETVSIYAPAVQIDSAALLLASSLASVLLPRTALAHASGNPHTVRRYYIRGTFATAVALIAAAPVVVWIAPFLLKLWLGKPMPQTVAILPLMLIHTVMGGSSTVGRSILLAIGKVRPFTLSVLLAGIANVVLGFIFVHFFGWGIKGIILGTIIAVVGRCVLWLPWYTLKAMRSEAQSAEPAVVEASQPPPLP
jgi:O-antigen/teichoic acid export membrane protein